MERVTNELHILLSAACRPDDVITLAFAGVIATRSLRPHPYNAPIIGLGEPDLLALRNRYFPGAPIEFHLNASAAGGIDRLNEFDDLLALLLEYRTADDEESRWLAHAVATASMADNHLWQDMGLPDRKKLSELLGHYFTELARLNIHDMKWKKFFYRKLCDRAGIPICRAPSCGVCSDYRLCFGSEEPD